MKPLVLVRELYQEYSLADPATDYTAVILSTYDLINEKTNSRVVLIKEFADEFLSFATNLNSKKAKELFAHPNCSLCFHWPKFKRQIRISANAEAFSKEEADNIFAARPLGHKIQAHISKQSEILEDYKVLLDSFEKAQDYYRNNEVPRPDYWSGFKLFPNNIEFWEEGLNRLHKRESYSLNNGIWSKKYLYP